MCIRDRGWRHLQERARRSEVPGGRERRRRRAPPAPRGSSVRACRARRWRRAIAVPGMRELMIRAGQEALDVGVALGHPVLPIFGLAPEDVATPCLLYTSDAADDLLCVDLGGRRII